MNLPTQLYIQSLEHRMAASSGLTRLASVGSSWIYHLRALPCHRRLWLCCGAQVSNVTILQNYYRQAYAAIRSVSPDALVGVVPRSGDADSAWNSFMAGPDYNGVVLATTRCGHSASIVLPALRFCTQPKGWLACV